MKTSRTALGLYGTLLVLPTLVFGFLYWRELQKDYSDQLATVPEKARNGAQRIASALEQRLAKLLQNEAGRRFTDYATYVQVPDALGDELVTRKSGIITNPTPEGILGWFNFNRNEGPNSPIQIFAGSDRPSFEGFEERLEPVVDDFRRRMPEDSFLRPALSSEGRASTSLVSAAIFLGYDEFGDCLKTCFDQMVGETLEHSISDFKLTFYVDDDGSPRALASRRVRHAGLASLSRASDGLLCLEPLAKGFDLEQGFLIDVYWLTRDLPFSLARQILSPDEAELVVPQEAGPMDDLTTVFEPIYPVQALGFDTFAKADADYGRLEVKINTDRISGRFESQSRRFLGVAGLLILTLATGMRLLYRSVQRELEHAHRMQNFVAAVTHELRTPVSSIRLHGEMLLDGWASEPDKQQEYYRRIVRETDRLSTLVENVLQKSRLSENAAKPEPKDLNAEIESCLPNLLNHEGNHDDLKLELAPNLPAVWLSEGCIDGILTNLVENARKYAPPATTGEPILIRSRWSGEEALLEVADRGPGVPAEERELVFDAFYRVGSEATRTTTGTGLGLHLVRLHAEKAGAKVSVHQRDGGGSIFRVACRPSARDTSIA